MAQRSSLSGRTGVKPEMSIARRKKEGGRGTRGVPMTESPREVQVKPASKVAGIWTKRHIGWLLRLRRDLITPCEISPESVAWSLRAMVSRGGLAVRRVWPQALPILWKFVQIWSPLISLGCFWK